MLTRRFEERRDEENANKTGAQDGQAQLACACARNVSRTGWPAEILAKAGLSGRIVSEE